MPKKAHSLQSLLIPQLPQPGDFIIDVTPIASYLVDLPKGETRGMLSEQRGFTEVLTEINANQASLGDKAGITVGDFTSLQSSSEIVGKIDGYLPAARKLVEILEESRAKYDDQRQRIIYATADAVDRRAKHSADGGTLLARYQKTREYRSAIALKGYKTRRRNAQPEAETQTEPETTTTPPTPPPATPPPKTTPATPKTTTTT